MSFSPEQRAEIEKAQRRFSKLKSDFENLNAAQLDALFREGRCQNGWQDRPVSVVFSGSIVTTGMLTSTLVLAYMDRSC